MSHPLTNDDYNEMLLTSIANESELFKSYVQSAIEDIDRAYLTEEIWLGTLNSKTSAFPLQVKLVVTCDEQLFVDEN